MRVLRCLNLIGTIIASLALTVPAHAAGLKLSTWNLDWLTLRPAHDPALPADVLPRTKQDFARLRAYGAGLHADVIAFQEVDGPQAAARVFDPAQYDLVLTNDTAVQRTGFAIRHGLPWTRNPDLRALDLNPDAPYPLRSGADITLNLPGGALRLLAIHLKSGCQDTELTQRRIACQELHRQIPPLARWIAARQHDSVAFAILGDFNRAMFPGEGMSAALQQAAPLTRVTQGRDNPCWGEHRPFIDHILLGGRARGWLVRNSLRVMVYRSAEHRSKSQLSDHCPVSIQLEPVVAAGVH